MDTNNAQQTPSEAPDESSEPTRVCGIVMPIAPMGDAYSAEHWTKVREILQAAITSAGMAPRLVWEDPDRDVIHSKILKNIYENDVVICDLSGLNPNVMLETGLRLSTKRPTVIVTDAEMKPPFDISNIAYIQYQKELQYGSINNFIKLLSTRIKEVHSAYKNGTYRSFVDNFHFESVSPDVVDVPIDQYLREKIETIENAVVGLDRDRRARLEREESHLQLTGAYAPGVPNIIVTRISVPEDRAHALLSEIGKISSTGSGMAKNANGFYEIYTRIVPPILHDKMVDKIYRIANDLNIEIMDLSWKIDLPSDS